MADDTFDEAVLRLATVVEGARAEPHRRGYFAAMYLGVSRAVQRAIVEGEFEDGERMDRFASIFAHRYLDALALHRSGGTPSRVWRIAFACDERRDRLILQHVVLGVNAHVNLDLAVAASEAAPGRAIRDLERDFQHVNDILANRLDLVQSAIGRFSPLLDILWRVSEGPDDEILNFSFRVARGEAWRQAVLLAGLAPADRATTLASIDRNAAVLARLVIEPGGILGRAVSIVHHTEREDVAVVIEALSASTPP